MYVIACLFATQCPYRHSETACAATVTCRQWMERSCQDINCPYRHPGGKEKSDTGECKEWSVPNGSVSINIHNTVY